MVYLLVFSYCGYKLYICNELIKGTRLFPFKWYLCKYCAKKKEQLGARATLLDVLDDMEQKNKAAGSKFGDSEWQATLGTKMHKAFMAEIGEEMCQAEVAHHANKCPEYFCSRPVKYVHIYKKALGISKGKQEDLENLGEMPWSSEGEGDGEGAGDVYGAGVKKSTRKKKSRRCQTWNCTNAARIFGS